MVMLVSASVLLASGESTILAEASIQAVSNVMGKAWLGRDTVSRLAKQPAIVMARGEVMASFPSASGFAALEACSHAQQAQAHHLVGQR